MNTVSNDPADYLRELGETGEGPYDIAEAALMLSALDHPDRDLGPYRTHLREIAEQAHVESRLAMTAEDGARAVAELLAKRHGYDGDRLAYDDPQNADLMAVIDRRRGLPVTLGVLYLHTARAAGFEASGLSSPGHFLLSIGLRGGKALIDPFNGGAALERERFGAPPGTGHADAGDLEALQPVSDTDVLLRLQNNIKLRALQLGDKSRAVEVAQRMVLLAPQRSELWMDLGHLHEDQGSLGGARKAYEKCLTLTKSETALHNEAALALQGLKRRLN